MIVVGSTWSELLKGSVPVVHDYYSCARKAIGGRNCLLCKNDSCNLRNHVKDWDWASTQCETLISILTRNLLINILKCGNLWFLEGRKSGAFTVSRLHHHRSIIQKSRQTSRRGTLEYERAAMMPFPSDNLRPSVS